MSHTPHILVVDDERSILQPLCRNLEAQGFRVTGTHTAAKARALLKRSTYDLILLDIMMPGETGLSLCQDLREKSAIPIILLTAMVEDADKIEGLELGADDYVTKPFNPRELGARIRTVLRRANASTRIQASRRIGFGDWILDIDRCELKHENGLIETLSTGELDVLKVFMNQPCKTLSRDDILSRTKGREAQPFERSVDVMISRLRHKIEADPTSPVYITTIWGGGYRFVVEPKPL